METIACDILIVGGGAGGTAAALASASLGLTVCVLEATDWLGGQLTAQGVCTPDEQQYIETFGGTLRYYAFRNAARQYYRDHYTLTPEAASKPWQTPADPALDASSRPFFNPGNCWVSRLAYEPKVGAALLREMARPFEAAGNLRILFQTVVTGCEMDAEGKTVIAVSARSSDGTLHRFAPRYVLDATDTGDLLPLCGSEGVDWVIGAESAHDTGEPDAPPVARPEWVQPFTFPFALDWSPETRATNVIAPPGDYEELKAQQRYTAVHGHISGVFSGAAPWWKYRRVLAKENFDDPRVPADLAMINTGGNDFYGGNILGADAGSSEDQARTLARARLASLGYVYWLQTECPREDDSGQTGYPELRLRPDVFDTEDGCAPVPYIRESRRIKALRPILQQEIVVKDFQGRVCRGDQARATFMSDSVGVGHYALDIHPNGHGEPNYYVPTRPFQIPLGALLPVRWENLLPACKNLGTTHLSNGAYRLHPIEWNIGESAGLLAAFCVQRQVRPLEVLQADGLLGEFQQMLLGQGIPLHWYVDVNQNHPAFEAVQMLASTGVLAEQNADLLFHPDEKITGEEWTRWCEAASVVPPPTFEGTRAEAAQTLLTLRV